MPRVFIGVYPPLDWAHRARSLAEACPASRAGRLPDAPAIHLTVLFVGEVADRRVAEMLESVDRAAAGIGAFVMHPARLIALPDRGAPRVLAVECDLPGPLREAHRRLVSRLAARPRDRDGLLPHLTVCRFGGGKAVDRPEVMGAEQLGAFEVREIRVMRSVLRPGGAVHAVMHRVSLGA